MSRQMDRTIARPLGRKRISRDPLAQVSFSVIAVFLLTATAVTGVYLAKRELDSASAARHERMLESMAAEATKITEELEIYAAFCANELVSHWSEFPVNETQISDGFSSRMAEHLQASFPRQTSAWTSSVRNWSGGLFLIERTTTDLVPSEAASNPELSDNESAIERVGRSAPMEEELGQRTVSPYYVAVGNFTVSIVADDFSFERGASFTRPIISSLPFLESKLRAFESASDGQASDLGRMVQYMLSTLGELRVLEGYGQPMYLQGLESALIITERDVYRAVLVALLLEQSRTFRNVDRGFAEWVADLCSPGNPGLTAVLSPNDRFLNPAELFLWFLGRTKVALDPGVIVAQAVFGLVDMMALKIMEYMGWLGTADMVSSFVEKVGDTLDSVVSFLTGEDKSRAAVVAWITRTVEAMGANEALLPYLFSAPVDFQLSVPERQYFVQDAAGNLYPVWVGNVTVPIDIESFDLMATHVWSDFYGPFKECQQGFGHSVKDACTRFAFEVASRGALELAELSVDPADGLDMFTAIAESAGEVCFGGSNSSQGAFGGQNMPLFSYHYELAKEFSAFVQARAGQIVDVQEIMDGMYPSLVEGVLASARYAYIPDLVVPVRQQLAAIVACDVENDLSWGVGTRALESVQGMTDVALSYLQLLVNSSVLRSDDAFSGPLVDALAGFVVEGDDKFPGMGHVLEETLSTFCEAMLRQQSISAFKQKTFVSTNGTFEFWDGDRAAAESRGSVLDTSLVPEVLSRPDLRAVPFDPSRGYESLERLFPTGDMLIQVKRPWEFDRSSGDYPNIHLTSMRNCSPTPYATQWSVSVMCLLDLSVSSDGPADRMSFMEQPAESSRSVRVDLEFPVVIHTGWPLHGVEYNPSNTVASDTVEAARKFCDIVWDKLEPVFGWVKEGFEKVFGFVTDVFDVLSSFATRLLKSFASAMQKMVEILQKYIQKIAESALAKAAQLFVDLLGTVEFRISLFGFLIIVQTNVPDLLYRHGDDILRVTVATKRFGPGISFGIRLARLSDGSFDILANGTITLRKASIEVKVDPLMHVLRRFAELHCKGKGWALDLSVPEVEPYELAEVSTADLPGIGGFLSDIPLPAVGMSASLEAGLRLKYSPPFPTDIVVNEFESNPHGEDDGKEWVELYNPLAVPKCVGGWTVETMHGKNSGLALHGTLAPNGVLVFTFPETSLDNGMKGDPFNDGDALVLRDSSGATVDVTPMCADEDNDERSWQRSWDGGPRWVFRTQTRSGSNGVPVLLATSDFVAKALFQAFKDSFEQTQLEEVTPSLEFLKLFGKRVLNNLVENLLSIVNETIHEVIFFIKIAFKDASGTAGLGLRVSFVVTGDAIVDVLRWLLHSFAVFVLNLGKAHTPAAYPQFPSSFLAGLFVRFEVLFEAGLPNMVRLLGAVGSLDRTFSCAIAISPNIPALGRLVGRSWGPWSVDFGVCLEGIPKESVQGFLVQETGKLVDLWLVKGRVYGT